MKVAVLRTLAAAVAAGTLVTAGGCGEPAPSSGGTAGPGAASSAPASSASPSGRSDVTTVTATVTRGKVSTAQGRVKVRRGTTVRITITGDAADEFHLHGYDRTLKITPGRAATLELVADTPGVFEAELHHSGARVFELQVS